MMSAGTRNLTCRSQPVGTGMIFILHSLKLIELIQCKESCNNFYSMHCVGVIVQQHTTELSDVRFLRDNFFPANKQKVNLIGWWWRQCLSLANQLAFLFVRADKFTKWKQA
jgi:hypothetical protein